MKSAREELERAERLLQAVEAHPLTAKVRADEAAATLAKRQEAAGRIETLRKEQANIPKLREAVDAVQAELKAHDGARKDLESQLALATLTLTQERQRLEREVNAAERVLLESYDPRIDKAIQHFRAKHEELLRTKPTTDAAHTGGNLINWTKTLTIRSNSKAIQNALAYCLAAIRTLEAMRLEPALDLGRIEALKNGIPDTTIMEEHVVEKPLPR